MAKHEFGVMQDPPEPGMRYDKYEPQKYACVSVDDEYVEKMAVKCEYIDCYWHSLDVPAKGLAYTGITLIPPTSLPEFVRLIQDDLAFAGLQKPVEMALAQNKWMIHFGL